MTPRLTVVVPTWNGAHLLVGVLESLRRQTYRDFVTVVVDNGSSDGTAELLREDYPEVVTVRLPENRGFAGGVNAGIREVEAEYVALLNNDAEADPEWLEALVEAMDRHPQAGSCASRILLAGTGDLIDSAGIRMGLFPSQLGHGHPDGPPFQVEREVFAPSGGAALYRRSALERVGLFDERLFAFFEDADLGCRLQLAGLPCVYVPGAVVRHVGSATAGRTPDWKFYLLMRNGLHVFFQNMPLRRILPWGWLVLSWPFVRAGVDHMPLSLAARAVRDFFRDLRKLRERRRRVERIREISWGEFARRLAPPLVRARQPLVGSRPPSRPAERG